MTDSTTPVSSPHLFCFGLGYSARVLAGRLRARGWEISATSRNADNSNTAYTFDSGGTLPDNALDGATHLLISAPPGADGDPVLNAARDEIARRAGQFAWVGYLSTTGVYGNRDGDWVDETAELCPSPGRSTWRAEAEAAWLGLHTHSGLPVHIFRLAGIYGPGRNAVVTARARQSRRIDKPGQVFCRTHVEDIATVLEASIARPNPGAVYNVCDDLPAPNHEIVALGCELAGVPIPPLIPYETAQLSPMARSFYADCRRVRNDRIKQELGVKLAYPTFRAGLTALARGEED